METITLTVNTTVDENDGSNSGTGLSLRDAVIIVWQSPPENQYIIELQGESTYSLNLNGNDINGGDLDLFNNLTIRGVGNEPAIIDGSGLTQSDRVLEIWQNANVTLENLRISGGAANIGGGIFAGVNTTVNLTNSEVSNNQSSREGGGIYSESTAFQIVDSRISGNFHNSCAIANSSTHNIPNRTAGIMERV